MKRFGLAALLAAIVVFVYVYFAIFPQINRRGMLSELKIIELPKPSMNGKISLEKAIAKRRSVREFKDLPVELNTISQLLWAAQGITEPKKGFRTVPSAGALYPLEVYLVCGRANGLEPGLYHYKPASNELALVGSGDKRKALSEAAYGQDSIVSAPICVVFTAILSRTEKEYGEKANKFVWMECGHAAQNLLLEATALDLGSVCVGGFQSDQVRFVMGLSYQETPLYIIPIGVPTRGD